MTVRRLLEQYQNNPDIQINVCTKKVEDSEPCIGEFMFIPCAAYALERKALCFSTGEDALSKQVLSSSMEIENYGNAADDTISLLFITCE